MGIKTGKKALFTEINITPLTDIFLVLLIIMMVVAPTFQSVDNAITVSVTSDGSVFVGDRRSSIANLSADLAALRGDNEKAEVVVKADEKVKSSIIMDIMDAAQDAHYKKLIVAGEPLNKKDQRKLEQLQDEATTNYTSNNTVQGASTVIPQNNNQYDNWSE